MTPVPVSTETERAVRAGKVEAILDFFFNCGSDPKRAFLGCREDAGLSEQQFGAFEASYRENFAELVDERAAAEVSP